MCFFCEACEQGTRFLRTGRTFEAGPFVALSGIKYVCENCARDFASAFGLFDAKNEEYLANLAKHAEHIVELEDEVASFAALRGVLAKLAPALDTTPRKSAAPRKVAAKATAEATE